MRVILDLVWIFWWPTIIGCSLIFLFFARRRAWSWFSGAVSLGSISALAVVATYIWPPSDPDFAGGVFVWNVSFGFPMLELSFICWLGGLIFYVGYIRQKERRTKLKIATPIVLLLPFVHELALEILFQIRLSI